MRVYEYARERGLQSADVSAAAEELKFDKSGASSKLDENELAQLDAYFAERKAEPSPESSEDASEADEASESPEQTSETVVSEEETTHLAPSPDSASGPSAPETASADPLETSSDETDADDPEADAIGHAPVEPLHGEWFDDEDHQDF